MNSNNDYEVYRTTTLGLALQETLDDMLQVDRRTMCVAYLFF